MKNIDPAKYIRLMVFNALLLALTIIIAVNLLETGGKPVTPASSAAPETARTVDAAVTPAQTPEANPASENEDGVPSPSPAAEEETQNTTFTMRFVGDLMCLDGQMDDALQPDGSYDFTRHFAQIKGELAGADVLLGNFEASLSESAQLSGSANGSNAPKAFAEALKDAGFDVLFTANGSAPDYQTEGLLETKQSLQELGFAVVGTNLSKEEAGTVYIRSVKGVPVAILAYSGPANTSKLNYNGEDASWAMNGYTQERLMQDVAAARALGAKVIVVYLNCGTEKETEPDRRQLAAAEEAAASGADAVIMSHTHTLQRMERRVVLVDGKEKTVFVAFGLGNFMSSVIQTESLNNIILNLSFTFDEKTDTLTDLTASYLLAYTYNFYDERKILSYSVVPLQQALADFAIVDARSRYAKDRFQAAYDKMLKRLGTDAAENVLTFHPAAASPAP